MKQDINQGDRDEAVLRFIHALRELAHNGFTVESRPHYAEGRTDRTFSVTLDIADVMAVVGMDDYRAVIDLLGSIAKDPTT